MLIELLGLPERRQSIGPELIRFFEEHAGDGWGSLLDKFLRMFSGTTFEVPGPEFMASLNTDKVIIRALRSESSISRRIDLMSRYGVSYSHILRIWQAVEGKMLPPPTITGRAQGAHDAAVLIRRYPKLEADIAQMFSLGAKERVVVAGMVSDMKKRRTYDPKETGMKPKPRNPKKAAAEVIVPCRMTAPQRRFVAALSAHGRTATPTDIKGWIGTISPTKTIRALVSQGLVRQTQTGRVSLTAKGRKLAA